MAHTEADIKAALAGVQDPDLKRDLVELGMIRDIAIDGDTVSLTIFLTTPACPLKEKLTNDVTNALKTRLGVTAKVKLDADTSRTQNAQPMIPGVRNVVLVASGKGGVGKSTVAANLAVSLAQSGARVGLLDADIYGPSVPTMFGLHEQPNATADQRIIPHRRHGLSIMSMGFLLQEGQPIIWRGPMLDSVLKQFIGQVEWGELDYLVVDLPPGTGDVQLSLASITPQAMAVVVTTPQDVALADVQRAIGMFHSVKIQVLGLVENMSTFICAHCGKGTDIFGSGAGERASKRYGIPLFGKVPLTASVVESGDGGTPIVLGQPHDPAALALAEVSARVAQQIAIAANAAMAEQTA